MENRLLLTPPDRHGAPLRRKRRTMRPAAARNARLYLYDAPAPTACTRAGRGPALAPHARPARILPKSAAPDQLPPHARRAPAWQTFCHVPPRSVGYRYALPPRSRACRFGSPQAHPGRAIGKERHLGKYVLTLFVTGRTPRAEHAIANLRRICEEDLRGQYALEVVDVLENPQAAEDEKILATPTLIKRLPLPLRRVIGDLSDKDKVLYGLDVQPVRDDTARTPDP
jgi:circadian clock protein KaiB